MRRKPSNDFERNSVSEMLGGSSYVQGGRTFGSGETYSVFHLGWKYSGSIAIAENVQDWFA